jgi:hypothetical protein
MRSNCWLEARLEYRRRVRAWRRDQSLPLPYWIRRPSLASRWLPHWLVGSGRPDGDIHPSSFKPESPQRLRWWQLPVAFLFRGRWVSGDKRAP